MLVGRNKFWQRREAVIHHGVMPSDGDDLPDDPVILQRMLQELLAENDKLRLLIQRFTRHQFGRRSEQLTADQLRVIELSFFEEKAHAEIARMLDIPLGTVKSRLRLAMNRLRNLLSELS